MHEEQVIGEVVGVTAGALRLRIDIAATASLKDNPDPVIAASGTLGSLVKVLSADRWVVATLRGITWQDNVAIAEVDLVGEAGIADDRSIMRFSRGVGTYPRAGSFAYPMSSPESARVFSGDDRPHIQVGVVYPTASVRAAVFFDTFLSKNFAIVGSTGTGKSTSTALILHRIIEKAPEGHVVMIDPHGEYAKAFANTGIVFNVENLQLPYWLLNFEEHCEVLLTSEGSARDMDRDILARCLQMARSKSVYAEGLGAVTTDTPIPYTLSSLADALQAEMGKMSEAQNATNYMRIRGKLDQVMRDPRQQFMFDRRYSNDTMADFIARMLRLPVDGKPISVIDLSGVPTSIVSAVVSVLSRIVFDFAVWSRGERRRPVVLICEEAHRYIPNRTISTRSSVRDVLERIAKEGRKYGVSLGLVTQRPSDLAEGALSQCGTIISLRLNNERDQDFVKAALPEGGKSLLEAIPALRNRECIISGEGVPAPIRVRLDELEPAKRPMSDDPVFSELWVKTGDDSDMLDRVITRWRQNVR
ncbi:ATP-binding protein [Sandarakinorhabdus rubra]|uniref:ATP-binding protein n=1 Tax=Sandarakinorhabdus rubra TaxID=2672568 RepID=UPI0013DA22BA|nr:ATP-binding protein [Sandarakinorhabdus rubra]